jgi:hypothetical protein
MIRSSSESRSRSREPVYGSGRGGIGNIHHSELSEQNIMEVDEHERATHQHALGVYVHHVFVGFSRTFLREILFSFFSGTPLAAGATRI